MKWNKGFRRSEFACRCRCGFDTVDVETYDVLVDVRAWAGASVHICSGCRCLKRNAQIGGSAKSKHMEGRAADIKVEGKTPQQVYEYLTNKYPDKYGIGQYKTFVHIDTRTGIWRKPLTAA